MVLSPPDKETGRSNASEPLRIFADARVVRSGQTGVGVFAEQMILHLAEIAGARMTVASLEPQRWHSKAANVNVVPVSADYQSHPKGDLYEHFQLPRVAAESGSDLFWGCAFAVPWAPMKIPKIVTIHDVTMFTYGACYPAGFRHYMRWVVRLSVNASQAIHVPSENTRCELTRLFPHAADRIFVVPEAASSWFQPEAEGLPDAAKSLKGGWLLAPSLDDPRKNVSALVNVWRKIAPQDWTLVLAGGRVKRETSPNMGVLQLGRVTLREMRALYSGAEAFVFPSLHEGFGLPVLEAMACGCPVVASRGGALPEVGGDAARYLDFSNGDEVDEWLRKMISSETPRSQPHGPSLERAASFSWKKSAQMFLDAARELITVKT
ncbi:hypothetical protein CVU37_10840 [candidate division BRC1 bacterium HGW-BRC1-1]|jgi:glycosyltransferase involved in cell wall biosynthesis|nr:MAG: hypothetical protein CVU37_10840 [candidate division BRC1 bacterium HGW-BRC1-1]